MRATGPTARPAHAFAHFVETDLYATFPSLVLLRRRNPANPLVSCQRSDSRPEALCSGVGFDGTAEVFRRFVDHATRGLFSGHTSIEWSFFKRAIGLHRTCLTRMRPCGPPQRPL